MPRSAPPRIVLAGATSLAGKELAEALGQSRLAAAELRLLDEEIVAGQLAAAAGEATVIQSVMEDSFEGAALVIFAGSGVFSRENADRALASGATVIDLSGALFDRPQAQAWIPALDALLPPPGVMEEVPRGARSRPKLYISPSAASIVACALGAAFAQWPLARIAVFFLRPVSERGAEAVEELESQTVKLLSFQPLPRTVFDAQVAFNLLDRYGRASAEQLADVREAVAALVRSYLAGRAPLPAVQLIQAPVFYGYTFSAFVDIDGLSDVATDLPALESHLCCAGFQMRGGDEAVPSNVEAAGETQPLLAKLERDPNHPTGLWLWGAVDNIRLATANAVAIAEKVVGP
jgi:aspartate-semialdehyde dehydrogenase